MGKIILDLSEKLTGEEKKAGAGSRSGLIAIKLG